MLMIIIIIIKSIDQHSFFIKYFMDLQLSTTCIRYLEPFQAEIVRKLPSNCLAISRLTIIQAQSFPIPFYLL